MQARPELRERLWDNAHNLFRGLQKLGFEVGPAASPVIAVVMPDRELALDFWKSLLEQGVYVNLVLPPATPSRHPLLRCSVSAAHTPAQIEAILQAFSRLGEMALASAGTG